MCTNRITTTACLHEVGAMHTDTDTLHMSQNLEIFILTSPNHVPYDTLCKIKKSKMQSIKRTHPLPFMAISESWLPYTVTYGQVQSHTSDQRHVHKYVMHQLWHSKGNIQRQTCNWHLTTAAVENVTMSGAYKAQPHTRTCSVSTTYHCQQDTPYLYIRIGLVSLNYLSRTVLCYCTKCTCVRMCVP